ncbi:MAG: hypothetical protein IT204_21275 [Fimbriimonadaceae bacterium]|nr:hypothetical protein [Fimbriimonadaceae bacterium]
MKRFGWRVGLAALLLWPLWAAPVLENGSFEADAYTVTPGTAAGNGKVITGWQYGGTAGLNPLRGSNAPYWDNGQLPHGKQLALIQGPGHLRTSFPAQAGRRYRLLYRENARVQRRGEQWPTARATLGGQEVVSPHEVTPVTGPDDFKVPFYRVVSAWHTAAADGPLELRIETVQQSPSTTLLLDDVRLEQE